LAINHLHLLNPELKGLEMTDLDTRVLTEDPDQLEDSTTDLEKVVEDSTMNPEKVVRDKWAEAR